MDGGGGKCNNPNPSTTHPRRVGLGDPEATKGNATGTVNNRDQMVQLTAKRWGGREGEFLCGALNCSHIMQGNDNKLELL